MKLSKKLTEALREAHIDFTSFDIVDIASQKDEHAVVIFVVKTPKTMPRFNMQYRGSSLWYDDLYRLMDICVEEKLYIRLAADRLICFYNESFREKGRVICGNCGRRIIYRSGMVRDTWSNYFGCALAKYQNDCDRRYIRECELNQIVWNVIQSLAAYTDKAVSKAKKVQDETGCRVSSLAIEIEKIQKKLEKCNTDKFSNIEPLMSRVPRKKYLRREK